MREREKERGGGELRETHGLKRVLWGETEERPWGGLGVVCRWVLYIHVYIYIYIERERDI